MKILDRLNTQHQPIGKTTLYRTEQNRNFLKTCWFMMGFLFFNIGTTYGQTCGFFTDEDYEELPIVTVKLNFHFFENKDGETYEDVPNVSPPPYFSGQWFAEEAVKALNEHCINIPQNELPGPNGVFANTLPGGDAKIRFVLYPNPQDAVHHYPYDSITNPNPLSDYVSVYGDDVLDIRIDDDGHPCITDSTHIGGSTSYYTTHFDLYNYYCTDVDISNNKLSQSVMLHEAFHTFGMRHSHHCTQRAFDIDEYEECHPDSPNIQHCSDDANACDKFSGNNLMNGTAGIHQIRAITPGQISLVFDHLLNTDLTNFDIDDCEINKPPLYLHSTTPIEWNTPKMFYRDVIVLAGTTLIIKCKTYMAHEAKIKVRPGARLILEGGEIGPICKGKEWGGIHVNGNADVAHTEAMKEDNYVLSPNDPGIAILKGGTLRYASTAIATKRTGADHQTHLDQRGGLIYAKGTHFINNRRSIQFLAYDFRNQSEFDQCLFESNRGHYAVTIWACHNILFNRCSFFDQGNLNGDGFEDLDVGICILDGGMIVENDCQFNDLSIGIECLSTAPFISSDTTVIGNDRESTPLDPIVSCKFDKNNRHIQASGQTHLIIQRNDFDERITGNPPGDTPFPPLGGVRIDSRSNFYIFKNNFNESNIWLSSNENGQGFISSNNISPNNAVFFGGIVVSGDNHATTFNYNCFDNPSKVDVSYRNDSDDPPNLRDVMGSNSEPYFNSFTTEHNPNLDIFIGNQSNELTYYYHPEAETNNPSLIPRCGINDDTNNCTSNPRNFRAEKAIAADSPLSPEYMMLNSCLSIQPPMPPIPPCTNLEDLDDIRVQIAVFQDMIDNGDTPALVLMVTTAPNASVTIQELESASPYLSDEVIQEIIMSPSIDPEKQLQILKENGPLSLAMTELSKIYLSPIAVEEISEIDDSLSPRKLIEIQMSDLEYDYIRCFEERLRQQSALNDYEGLEETLLFDGTTNAIQRLFGLQLRKKDYTAAAAILATLPAETTNDEVFKNVQAINLAFLTAPSNFELTQIQEDYLYSVAYDTYPSASYARGLLSLLKGKIFLVTEEENNAQQSITNSNIANTSSFSKIDKLTVFPNPADNQVTVQIPQHFTISTNTFLKVVNANGRLMKISSISDNQYRLELNTQDYQNGLYFIGLWKDGILEHFERIIIAK